MHCAPLVFVALVGSALALPQQAKPKPKTTPATPAAARASGPETLVGNWLFTADVTPDRTPDERGTNYGSAFSIRLDAGALVLERPGSSDPSVKERRFTLDGSTQTETANDVKTTYSGLWRDGVFTATWLTEATGKEPGEARTTTYTFTPGADGMRVAMTMSGRFAAERTCIYRLREQVELRKPVAAKATAMKWLAGDWGGAKGKRSTEESWSEPDGGALLGTSRTLSGGKMVAFEFLRVVEQDGRLLYVAQPGGRSATEFTLVELGETRAVFEDPFHDYPQRITYERVGDQLTAVISQIDGSSPQRFDFKRAQ